MRRRVDMSIADAVEGSDGSIVTVGGVITGFARRFTKRGDQMGVFVLEDLQSAAEVTLFPRTLAEHGHKLADDAIVLVRARLDKREEGRVGLLAQDITVLNLVAGAPDLKLHLPAIAVDPVLAARLRAILGEHPGESQVLVDIGDGKVFRLPDSFNVNVDTVVGALRVAFGHEIIGLNNE